MPALHEILQANFKQYYCISCSLFWWLGKEFIPHKCPFRGHSAEVIYEKNRDAMILEGVSQEATPLIELPEQLTVEELGSIFSKYKE